MSSSTPNLAIPLGSLVVVTGANGFIASHVVDQLLHAGYKVRGCVRSLSRTAWEQHYFDAKYGTDKFSRIEVPDMAADGAYDEALVGAAGLCHVATPVMQAFDPNVGIPVVVNGTLNALEAAVKSGTVKRVVLTSSSTAAADPHPNKKFHIGTETWNDEILEAAWAPPPYEGDQRRLAVYSASKLEGEKAAWKFIKEKNPDFVLNTVLPNCNMGPILSIEHQGYPSTAGWVKALWDGGDKWNNEVKANPPQYYINVQDNAMVHVAALIYEDVKSERLFTFAKPFNFNDILAIFRKQNPGKEFMDDIEGLGRDLSTVENERAEELLKRVGAEKWASLEESVNAIITTLE